MGSVRTWDWEDGDAQLMAGVEDCSVDFVHSSHCLEHLVDPAVGLKNWIRVLKPGGHLIVTVPDEDLYEQGIFPSTFNRDHKWTFTIFKSHSWSDRSLNVLDLIRDLGDDVQPMRVCLLDSTYRYDLPRFDQTLTPVGECGIEFVIRKRPAEEIVDKGRWRRTETQPSQMIRIHFNQYRNDMAQMKTANLDTPPFSDDGLL